MQKLTEQIISLGLESSVLTHYDIKRIFKGSPASIYALVNKALQKDELIHLKRGVYVLNPKYSQKKLSKFYIACHMVTNSYISFESALSYHGWIPEEVTIVSSAINRGRSKSFKNFLGEFHYKLIPINRYEFLTGVSRKEIDGLPFLIAQPLRALLDYVYEKKIDWSGYEFLTDSLRIDVENLIKLNVEDFVAMKQVYRSKRVLRFLKKLEVIM